MSIVERRHIHSSLEADDCVSDVNFNITICQLRYDILIITHLKLCLANASNNSKCPKTAHMCLAWDQTFTNFDF